jgi:hypothetical protein
MPQTIREPGKKPSSFSSPLMNDCVAEDMIISKDRIVLGGVEDKIIEKFARGPAQYSGRASSLSPVCV